METYNIFYLISVRVEEGEGLGAKPDPLPELGTEPVHQGHHLHHRRHDGQEHEEDDQEHEEGGQEHEQDGQEQEEDGQEHDDEN